MSCSLRSHAMLQNACRRRLVTLARGGAMLPILLSLVSAAPGSQEVPPAAHVGIRNDTEVSVPRLEQDAVIDGFLDEPAWLVASVLTGFSQYEPVDQRPATDTTQVLVWYSPTGIYFGIKAFEDAGPVNATLADRDRIDGDDYVQLLLDTFDDQRQAFCSASTRLESSRTATGPKESRAGRAEASR